jgi:outer membrane protein assembly factor BamD
LIRTFSSSEYVASAKEKIASTKKMIVDKEKYIADFYYKTKVYDAALYRYLDIIRTINDLATVEHAMVRVLMTTTKLEDGVNCKRYFNQFSRVSGISAETKDRLNEAGTKCPAVKGDE